MLYARDFIATEMTDALSDEAKQKYHESIPLGRFGKSSEVAELVSFLLSRSSSYITGETFKIDGDFIYKDSPNFLGDINMEQKVITLISDATKIEASRINATTNFVEDLKLDSLDIVELMMKMEDEFGVEIPEEDAESLKTVQDVVSYLEKKN